MKKVFLVLFVFSCLAFHAKAQKLALKTNLLYGVGTFTPNLSLEVGLGYRSTLDFGGGYNWINLNGSELNNRKKVHWLGQVEYRYWLCSRFAGHFFGIHALGTQYNIGGYELPLLFGKGSKNYRYQGWGVGGGISYGYSFYLGKRWSLEASVGVGYAFLQYDQYDCAKCGTKIGSRNRHYVGPTRAALSLIYFIK